MFKKLVIASAVLAISGAAFANAPYFGVSVGEKTNSSNNRNARGVPATLSVGYGALVSQSVYMAGEIFGTAGTANVSDNGLKSTYGYGVSFIPGVMISDHTMGYARIGAVRTRFTPTGLSNRSVTGGQLGLGLQTSLMQSWDLRGEYTYTAYSSLSGVSGSPRSDEFTVGLVYKFE